MPTKPVPPEVLRETVEAWERHGRVAKYAADELGVAVSTFKHRLNIAKINDPAITEAKAAVGTSLTPVLAWAKTKSEDGTSYSVLLKPTQEDIVERLHDAFDEIRPADPLPSVKYCDEDLLTIYPIADAHVGMMAWGRETGADYDTKLACARIREWMARVVAASPPSKQAVVVDVGDLTHANDDTNATPRSKHVLDVDTRFFKTVESVIAALTSAIGSALEKHEAVKVVILPGNHDPYAYLAVLFALDAHYRNEPRVDVIKQPGEFWVHQFGLNMIGFHHGDKAKAERLVLWLADEFPEMWGATRYRKMFTGHLHHHKSADIGGCEWEQLRALTEKDAYARSHAYSARAQLQGITIHKDRGEVSRVKVTA